jgi:hypothetical protein
MVCEYGVIAFNVICASSGMPGTTSFTCAIALSMATRAASRLLSMGVFLDRTSYERTYGCGRATQSSRRVKWSLA